MLPLSLVAARVSQLKNGIRSLLAVPSTGLWQKINGLCANRYNWLPAERLLRALPFSTAGHMLVDTVGVYRMLWCRKEANTTDHDGFSPPVFDTRFHFAFSLCPIGSAPSWSEAPVAGKSKTRDATQSHRVHRFPVIPLSSGHIGSLPEHCRTVRRLPHTSAEAFRISDRTLSRLSCCGCILR
jgi:hypothetical protein